MESRVCITVENSLNPFSVYIRLCKYRKEVFYCFYKLTFPRKIAKLFVIALIKREILTSCEVYYTKSCTHDQFLFCPKNAFQKIDFSRLKCQFKQKKKIDTAWFQRFSKYQPTRKQLNKVNLFQSMSILVIHGNRKTVLVLKRIESSNTQPL